MATSCKLTEPSPLTTTLCDSTAAALESMSREIALRWYGSSRHDRPPYEMGSPTERVPSQPRPYCRLDSAVSSIALEQEIPGHQSKPRRLDRFSWWWWWEIGSLITSVTSLILLIGVLAGYQNRAMSEWRFPLQPNTVISILTTTMKTTILLSVSACFSQLKWYYFSTPRRLNDLEIYDEASRGPWGAFLILLQCRKSTILTTALAITTLASLLVEPSAQQILGFQSREITQKDADVSIVNSHGFKLRFSNDSNDGYLAKTLGIRSTLVNAATGTISSFSFRCPDSATRCTYPAFTTLGICSLFHNTTDLSTQSCAYNHTTGAIFCNVLLPSTWNEVEGARPIVMGLNYTDKELVPRLYDTSPENQSAFDDIFSYGRADGQLEFTRGPYLRMSGVRLLPRFLSEPKDPQFEAFESIWYWCARTYNASTGSAEAVFPELVSTRTLTPIQPDCWESHPDFCTYSDNVTSEVYSLDGYTVWWLHRYIYYALASSFALARSSEDTSYGQSGDVADIGGYLYSVPDLDEVFQNVATQASHIIRIAGGENENTTIVEGVAFGLETYIDVRWGWVLLPFIETLLAVVLLVATIVLASKSRQPLFKSSVNALLFHGLEDSMATDLALHINDKQPLSVLQAMSRDLEVRFQRNEDDIYRFVRT